MSAITLENLSYFYESSFSILEKVSVKIPKGSFLGIIGPNGGGKTTLLRLIAGFLNPTSGKIFLDPSLKVGSYNFV